MNEGRRGGVDSNKVGGEGEGGDSEGGEGGGDSSWTTGGPRAFCRRASSLLIRVRVGGDPGGEESDVLTGGGRIGRTTGVPISGVGSSSLSVIGVSSILKQRL